MMKQGMIISAVFYALLTSIAPGLIVCRHSDGRTMLELAAAPCCAEKKEKRSKCCTVEVRTEDCDSISSAEDSCYDSPVTINNALLSQPCPNSNLELSLTYIDLTLFCVPQYEAPVQVYTDFHDPPPTIVITFLSNIVILC